MTDIVDKNNVQRDVERRRGGKEQMTVEVGLTLYFSRDWVRREGLGRR